MEECRADKFLVKYGPDKTEAQIKVAMKQSLSERLGAKQWFPDLQALNKYSARESARKLVEGMEAVICER